MLVLLDLPQEVDFYVETLRRDRTTNVKIRTEISGINFPSIVLYVFSVGYGVRRPRTCSSVCV